MTNELEKYLCQYCGIQLVETDKSGKLEFGRHEKGCPATFAPEVEGPARKAAKAKLICEDCPNQHSDIIDLGNGLAHCAKCGAADLAKDARASQTKEQGKNRQMDIIHPAPRKTVGHWKRLYLDLLQKHAIALAKLEQYENGQ